jgi:peptidoglycan/LPS O-acetylase OafA/YrhL
VRVNFVGQLLSRKTSNNFFIPEIDGFRFFAIASVLLYHLNTHLTRVFDVAAGYFSKSLVHMVTSRGSVGVDVFFAISGFILALPFARQHLFATPPVSLKSYYLRRITRLEPPPLCNFPDCVSTGACVFVACRVGRSGVTFSG